MQGRDSLFDELTRIIVAAVAPERLREFPPTPFRMSHHDQQNRLARVMSEHGHSDFLRNYVMRDAPLADIPLAGIEYLMGITADGDERRALLRRAIEFWCEGFVRRPIANMQFEHLFRRWWKVLPHSEALETLRKMVDRVLAEPDQGACGEIQDIPFSSAHALAIFLNFDVLLELDPVRAAKLSQSHPELASALKRYPKGKQSIYEEAEAERASLPPPDENHYGGIMGFGDDTHNSYNYGLSLFEAKRSKDFGTPLKHAAACYREDADRKNPNRAPKEFWPSSGMYRSIFHGMGKVVGESAAQSLESVPDPDLRLFAQIELAAGLCGLPELSVMTQTTKRF
jgi:hypothetical protein